MARVDAARFRGVACVTHQLANVVQQRSGNEGIPATTAARQLRGLQCVLKLSCVFAIALRSKAREEIEYLLDDVDGHASSLALRAASHRAKERCCKTAILTC